MCKELYTAKRKQGDIDIFTKIGKQKAEFSKS